MTADPGEIDHPRRPTNRAHTNVDNRKRQSDHDPRRKTAKTNGATRTRTLERTKASKDHPENRKYEWYFRGARSLTTAAQHTDTPPLPLVSRVRYPRYYNRFCHVKAGSRLLEPKANTASQPQGTIGPHTGTDRNTPQSKDERQPGHHADATASTNANTASQPHGPIGTDARTDTGTDSTNANANTDADPHATPTPTTTPDTNTQTDTDACTNNRRERSHDDADRKAGKRRRKRKVE